MGAWVVGVPSAICYLLSARGQHALAVKLKEPRGIFAFLALLAFLAFLALIAFLALTAYLAFLALLASIRAASLISALSKARGEGGELAGQVRTRGQGWTALQLSLQKRSPLQ